MTLFLQIFFGLALAAFLLALGIILGVGLAALDEDDDDGYR